MSTFTHLKNTFGILLLLAVPQAFADTVHAKAIPPSPTSYVYDETGKLTAGFKQELFERLSKEDHVHGNQIVVAFFDSLENEDLVDYTNRIFTTWNPGAKAKNNGVLIAAFLKEHKIRIEVGYGLEPYITDAKSKGVILNDLTPAFKAGDFDGGVDQATRHLISVIHQGEGIADPNDAQTATADSSSVPMQQGRGVPILLIIVIIFLLLRNFFFGRRRSGIFWGGGGWGGGGFGGGSFGGGGGGGFSGGGGMSGGGGASGDW